MHIAILGGSFDPPHNGHLSTAHQILKLTDTQQIWLMPCFQHPFNKILTPFAHRLQMTKFLTTERIQVSDFEIRRRMTSYTIDTLTALALMYPNHTFSWIIGDDQLPTFQKWKNWQEILTKFNLIIVPRSFATPKVAFDIPNAHMTIIKPEQWTASSVSSSQIRDAIKFKRPIISLVPLPVAKYIVQNRFYTT
ncbi:nicotinate-nucleotide adenylyltransferase [soil metagenome]